MKGPFIAFILSLSGFVFGLGVIVGAYEVFPYQYLKYVLNSVESVLQDENLFTDKPIGFLAERRYQGDGVTRWEPEQTDTGYTLLAGFFDELPEIRLIHMDGTPVRRWPLSYKKIFPSNDHIFPEDDRPASDWNVAVHGVWIHPDGSIVFNFDGKGTAKLDACGSTVWTIPRMTHHSVDYSVKDGSYWIPSRHYLRNNVEGYERFKKPFRDDTILNVSSDGEVLSEQSVTQILINSGLISLLLANGRFTTTTIEPDVLHLNDIEVLDAKAASAFDLFSAGDLLLSLRHLNLLLVVDQHNWRVKWYQIGPWIRQHDPDFHEDGTISVFNNNSDDTQNGALFGGSNIISIRPSSPARKVEIVYGRNDEENFFTNTQGKHQRLRNGNLLIAEYSGGRVIEVSPKGKIAWEYVNQYDDIYVAKLSGAYRYPEDYFSRQDWSCSKEH